MFTSTVYDKDVKEENTKLLSLSTIIDFFIKSPTSYFVGLPLLLFCVLEVLWFWAFNKISFGVFISSLIGLLIISLTLFYITATIPSSPWLRSNVRYKPWENEIAVITGGSNGIGSVFVQRLLAKECKIVILDISEPLPEVTKNENIRFIKCDLSQKDQVYSAVQVITEKVGDITILINNAGICYAKPLMQLSDEQILKTFHVNALAHFWTCKAALPTMIKNRYGHVINVASTMGLTGVSEMTSYCSSKFAAVGFHESLRQEIRKLPFPHLIHTTLICPGLILTGMFKGISMAFPFLTPPLSPEDVGDVLVEALETVAYVDLDQVDQVPFWEDVKQHKVIWTPISYAIGPLIGLIAPCWLTDYMKNFFGANSAITPKFVGRS